MRDRKSNRARCLHLHLSPLGRGRHADANASAWRVRGYCLRMDAIAPPPPLDPPSQDETPPPPPGGGEKRASATPSQKPGGAPANRGGVISGKRMEWVEGKE